MVENVVDLYWEMGEKYQVILFIEEAGRREIGQAEDWVRGSKGWPTDYLAWKMMMSFCWL